MESDKTNEIKPVEEDFNSKITLSRNKTIYKSVQPQRNEAYSLYKCQVTVYKVVGSIIIVCCCCCFSWVAYKKVFNFLFPLYKILMRIVISDIPFS